MPPHQYVAGKAAGIYFEQEKRSEATREVEVPCAGNPRGTNSQRGFSPKPTSGQIVHKIGKYKVRSESILVIDFMEKIHQAKYRFEKAALMLTDLGPGKFPVKFTKNP